MRPLGGAVAVVAAILVLSIPPSYSLTSYLSLFRNRDQEPVKYKVVEGRDPRGQAGSVQERRYPARTYACTVQEGGYADSDQLAVFNRLFSYIDGGNDRGQTIAMGLPVSVRVDRSGPQEVYEACFPVPAQQQKDPPKPNNSAVQLKDFPAMNVLTQQFGGFATTDATWLAEERKLRQAVVGAGDKVSDTLVFWNAYDSPFKLWNRRNEVWLVKE